MVDVYSGAPAWSTQEPLPSRLYEVPTYVVDTSNLRKAPARTGSLKQPVITDHPPKVHDAEANNKVRVTVPLRKVSKNDRDRRKKVSLHFLL